MGMVNLNSMLPKSQLFFEPKKTVEKSSPVAEMMDNFQYLFEKHIQKVDHHLKESGELTRRLATGEIEDIHSVMIAAQKAQIALSFTIALRDRLITAYTDILAMGR